MSLILHLSDLHLGSPSCDQFDYTDKYGLEHAAGDTSTEHLKRTVRALGEGLQALGRTLDAIVVSGDLTNANNQDGYDEFKDLLALLGDCLPDPQRIIVTPGNHDADWTMPPGEPRKLKRFLSTVRSQHCSPLMFGVDYKNGSLSPPRGGYRKAKPILELDDAVIVALSSSDFCGVEEQRSKTDWTALLDSYLAEERKTGSAAEKEAAQKTWEQAQSDLRRLRVADMARVHPHQLDALDKQLKTTSVARPPDEDPRLRIAVLHHPIAPVTDHEEIKPFESLTNLSGVRSFLFEKGFHVVLHGHKHNSYLGWDWLLPPGDQRQAAQWRTFVICSPGEFRQGGTVCRLLDTRPSNEQPVAGAPRLRLVDVKGVRSGQQVELDFTDKPLSLAQPFVRSEDPDSPWVVCAKTADAAYQQLRDLPTSEDRPRQVISIVEAPESTSKLPSNYRQDRDDEWLRSLVKWWQLPRPEAVRAYAGAQFNHGERLYGEPDAIKKAALALPSSKAIAVLVNASDAGTPEREYPALTAVQLQARRDENMTRIEVVGLFRKQDLALWWPINMAELAHIQAKALEYANDNPDLQQPLGPGRLIAMTSIGVHAKVLPQIAGTTLDRSIDLQPGLMQRLAYLAEQPRLDTEHEWESALSDIGTVTDKLMLVQCSGSSLFL